MVDGSLGAVEVFGLLITLHRAGAEADDRSLRRTDREHDAVAEGVIAASVLLEHEPGGKEFLRFVAVSRENGFKSVPSVRRIAEAEALCRFTRNFAGLQVVDRLRRIPEAGRVESAASFMKSESARAFFLASCLPGVRSSGTSIP